MKDKFLLYGATGFVGEAIARMAIKSGLRPVLAGRNKTRLKYLASELGVDYTVFGLDDPKSIDKALKAVPVLLNCAGPFVHTFKPIVEACLRTGTHYLDITGEIPVYQAIADLDEEAKAKRVMLLPGIGFDVVPTDCLAVHLKNRLPSATHLTVAFQSVGPARLPPGTQRTMIEMIPYGNWVRREGKLVVPKQTIKTRQIDLGNGLEAATRITWGDVFTAYYSTGIPNIEDYLVLPVSMHRKMAMLDKWRPIFKLPFVRNYLKRKVKPGPDAQTRAETRTYIWGEAADDQNRKVVSRLHGPEAGVEWTGRTALAAVKRVLDGDFVSGFQTPGMVFGADFVLECEGVSREDL